LTFSKIK